MPDLRCRRAARRAFLLLLLYQLDAAIECAAILGVVGGDGREGSVAVGLEPAAGMPYCVVGAFQ